MNLVGWIRGLVASVIGGAAHSVSVVIIDPTNFNLTNGWQKLASFAAVSALISAALFLQKSPLPGDELSITPRDWPKDKDKNNG